MSPHRSSKSQSDRKKKNSSTIGSPTKHPRSFTVNQAGASTSSPRLESTYENSCLADSQPWTSSKWLPAIPDLSTSRQGQKARQHAIQVISGISSLGINTSPCLQQAIESQYGSVYTYTTFNATELPISTQNWNYNASPQQSQWVSTWAESDERLDEDLAGIGAQFESQSASTHMYP